MIIKDGPFFKIFFFYIVQLLQQKCSNIMVDAWFCFLLECIVSPKPLTSSRKLAVFESALYSPVSLTSADSHLPFVHVDQDEM